MKIPEDLKYTKEHEWIKINGKTAIVGITDYAQSELGDIIYVDVTVTGESFEAGASFGTIEAVKTVSDLFMPVGGKIIEFNSSVNDNPAIVNQDPYGDGWLVKIEITGTTDGLLDAEEYKKLIGI
jgi:glycine cleavage system H protein